MKNFYILINCIAFLTLLFQLKARLEIICKNFTSSSFFALTHFFEFAELYHNSPNHNVGITTTTNNHFFITVTTDLSEGSTA
jgi:hypothetical protein